MVIKMGEDLNLGEFADWVAEDPKRVRIPYKTWKILTKWERDKEKVDVLYEPSEAKIKIFSKNDITVLIFDIFTDKGFDNFGAWICNKFFSDKEMEEKGEDNMKILNKSKFNFGTCENDNVRMSLYGLAVKNAEGTWVSYDPKTDSIMDADILNFDGRKFLFKMPVALKDIAVGDIILHNGIPMFVKNVGEDSRIVAIDPLAGEEKVVMLTKNCFGFDFATKIVSLFKLGDNVATPDAPFGNMLPFLLMGEDKDDIDPITMCMMMNQGGDFMSNPMMTYFLLMKDSDKKDMFPFFFMMNANK